MMKWQVRKAGRNSFWRIEHWRLGNKLSKTFESIAPKSYRVDLADFSHNNNSLMHRDEQVSVRDHHG
jgi:hypothetical protein